ncbi:Histone deacetylase 4, variant 2 [Chamberlinius hualienensis]
MSPVITRRITALSDANNPAVALSNNIVMDTALEQQLEQQLRQLRKQHELQQQFLIEQFQQQQRQLKTQQELQLQQHISEYREQQRLEESRVEQERLEKVKLEAIKKKEKHEQSAVASEEVKKQLAKAILRRKAKESVTNFSNNSQSSFQNWQPLLGQYDNNYPLQKSVDGTGSSTPDSSPNSPPNGVASLHSRSSSGSTPIQEEPSGSSFGVLSQGNLSDHALHSSPSLPNISLGKPPGTSSSGGDSNKVTSMSEAQLRAMAASLGMPLTGHVLPGILPFYPSLPASEAEFTPPTSPAYIPPQMKSLELSRITGNSTAGIGSSLYPGIPITDAQVAHARLYRAGHHRPLSRTQSAPLPLGHPMLQPQVMVISRQQQERYIQERQLYEQQQQHNLLKQTSIPVISEYYEHDLEFECSPSYSCMSPYSKHIRQTVLTRAGSKNHVENVEEETEAAVALALGDQEVIDLTDKKSNSPDSELHRQQRERETFLQQQRDIMMRHTQTINEEPGLEGGKSSKSEIEGAGYTRHHVVRPLSRAFSSPLVTLSPTGSPQETLNTESIKHMFTTGLAFDTLMLKHQCICGDNTPHLEHHGRLKSIWARLQETGLVSRCEKIPSRKATLEELQSCHSESYTLLFGTNPLSRQKLDLSQLVDLPIKSFVALSCGGVGVDSDTTWNEMHTSSAARMAAGCVIDLSLKTASLDIKNGFALVRPPGHHAEHNQAMGFCFFNSVAIAAKQLRQRLNLERILIVDWDVHHGNGTQQMFYNDRHVLYVSLHRHDEGNFFPGTGGPEEVGVDDGIGFNVNIAWSSYLRPPMGDAEYMAAFRTIIMPIARDFNPEIVLVSCGFDAAASHPDQLGGYKLSPQCFGHMTRQLMQLAGGRVILSLEGGYDLQAICDCAEQCVKALLGDEVLPLSEKEMIRKPCQAAIETLQKTVNIQVPHWPCIKRWGHMIGMSVIEAQQKEKEESETVSALASLSMVHGSRNVIDCGMFATQNGNAVSVVTSAPSAVTNTAPVSTQHNESRPSSLRSSPDHGSPIEVEEPMEQEDTDAK